MKHASKFVRLLSFALSSLAAAAQGTPPTGAAPQVEAIGPQAADSKAEAARIVLLEVDGEALTLADALNAFTLSHTGHGALVRGEPALRELMGRLIERQLFLGEAEALGLSDDPVLKATIEEYERSEVVAEFWKREVDQKLKVTDEEVEAFYAKTDVALKLTLIETRERERCEKLRERVVAGEDMGALATTESTHPSRSFGGLLPYVRRGEIDPELEKVVFDLVEPKSLSPVVATEKGFAFARLEERSVNPTRLPREVAIPQIRKILRDRAQDKVRAEVEARLEKEGDVAIEEPLLLPEMVLDKAEPGAIVARSMGHTLKVEELRAALDLEALRQQAPETVQGAARVVARDWAMRQVIWEGSAKSGLRDDPDLVVQIERRRRETLLNLLCERYVYADIALKEDDFRAHYEKNKDTLYVRQPERRLAYIAVATKDEAEKILARYKGGETFEALAKEVSLDRTSAQHGGRIGWAKKGDLLPEVEARAFEIPKGSVDGPIETPAGWFLVYVLDVREAEVVPYATARLSVQRRVLKERQQEAWDRWSKRLRDRAVVKVDEDGVRAAVAWLDRQPTGKAKPIDPNVPHAPAPGEPKTDASTPPDKKG